MNPRVTAISGEQFNRISRVQLAAAGVNESAIKRHIASGRLTITDHGVVAISPVLTHDPWGRWMSATLTEPGTWLSQLAASVAWKLLLWEGPHVTVTRVGSGGPRRHGNLIVHRSRTLEGDVTTIDGIPITTVPRTLIDIAGATTPRRFVHPVSDKALARAVRESVRLEHVTLPELGSALGRYRGCRGIRRLAAAIASYSGLPLERARSGAEVVALQVLRAAGHPMPRLNVDVAGEEADLSWPKFKLIVEIDGDPFHQDVGEDARKEKAWREAGWLVRRVPSDDVYERPHLLLAHAPAPNVPE